MSHFFRKMDALGIKIEPTAGDATNSGIEQVKLFLTQGFTHPGRLILGPDGNFFEKSNRTAPRPKTRTERSADKAVRGSLLVKSQGYSLILFTNNVQIKTDCQTRVLFKIQPKRLFFRGFWCIATFG